MIVYTISEIIKLIIITLFILIFIIFIIYIFIKGWFNKHFRQNCYKCKHYYLQDVAGAGDCCWYNCKLHNEYHKDRHSMNDKYMYRKCKNFEKENN